MTNNKLQSLPNYEEAQLILRDQRISEHMEFAETIALQMGQRVPARLRDELPSVAVVGLVDAASKYDESKGSSFQTYAFRRIRGSVLDHLRTLDYLGRADRTKLKALDKKLPPSLSPHTISSAIEDMPACKKVKQRLRLAAAITLEAPREKHEEEGQDPVMEELNELRSKELSPEQQVIERNMSTVIQMAIKTLSMREQSVIRGRVYSDDPMTLEIMARHINVCPSRVFQIETAAKIRLRQDSGIQALHVARI